VRQYDAQPYTRLRVAELLRRELQRENLLYLLGNIEPPTVDLRIRLYTLLNELESGKSPTEN